LPIIVAAVCCLLSVVVVAVELLCNDRARAVCVYARAVIVMY
jgi:hypothetical protein